MALVPLPAWGTTPFYEEVFVNFGETNAGTIPNGKLTQAADGNFYGTTQEDGVRLGGNVFRLTPAGKLTAFHPFTINPSEDGYAPQSALTLGPDGNFYCTTTLDSGNSVGAIFKLSLANKYQRLAYNIPEASIGIAYTQFTLAKDGTFYATIFAPYDTSLPSQYPRNAVVRFRTNGVYLFTTNLDRATTGAQAKAALTEGADHNFYGVASEGGIGNAGTIFKVTPAGVVSLVYSFNGPDGRMPESQLVLASDGNFYGTTTRGGVYNKGTIFRLTPAGILTTLVPFAGANGSNPAGGLTAGGDGNLYGTTNLGGVYNKGTFYRFTLDGTLTKLASFTAATGSSPANGVTLGFDGNFYGTTLADGDKSAGTAYRVTRNGAMTKLASFGDTEGYFPQDGVIQGADGYLYGATGIGGSGGEGTVFRITQYGTTSTLARFTDDDGGPTPLAQGPDGALYVATSFGGAHDGGNVYKVTLNGTRTKLADLNTTTGKEALDLLRGQDGNFYGLTAQGGSHNAGTIFRLTPAGAITLFATLDLRSSSSSFSQDADGNFYGTTEASIGHDDGIAFKVNSAGVESTIGVFEDTKQHIVAPLGGITRGPDGNFYGVAAQHNLQHNDFTDVLYRLTPAGTITPLTPAPGASHLLRMTDGSFFGTTDDFENNRGAIFRATTAGLMESWPVFNTLHGYRASGRMTPASDGYVYGTTGAGGTLDAGVLYRFTTNAPQLLAISQASARPREFIILSGRHLAGTTAVSFNGVTARSFTIDTSTRITVEVPPGANAGPIRTRNALGTATTPVNFTPLPPISALQNISTRGKVLTDDNVLIAGFVITGTGQKQVLLRGIGPSLTAFHVSDALQNPILELHDGNGGLIATNDNWSETQEIPIKGTHLAPADARESAILRPLSPGSYTAILKGASDTTGIGLVEVYDLDRQPALELANISTRGFVGTGNDAMIAGFVVGEMGSGPTRELIRATGPSLSAAHVTGALQDPRIELHNSNGALVATNDNWGNDLHAAQIHSMGLAPSDPRESAMLPSLNPGAYTAIVRGANTTTGVALIEAYNLH
jgi:uncharacterized repeat protein (TIGR03803 family)